MLAVLVAIAVVLPFALEAALSLLAEVEALGDSNHERQMNRPFKVASARMG
ncbi:hypothetical protein [Rhizobium sp. LCM 4573]|uniref:hypothetical protein n=1 Tax=Rhizobium sp. LCM 4573 TaxID=1848291 RepID=UPI000AD7996E|nr:hypothetical protein [Rhizobium sp. LCM 4573]